MGKHRDAAIVKFINSQPWAILPENLDIIASVVADHMADKPVDLKASPKAKVLSSVAYPNVAIVGINGTLAKKLYGMDAISGGETMGAMQKRVQAALDDPNIEAIVLQIDSPGGTVAGTKEFADFIAAADKPIVAYADGLMASAAYWIGSAADKVVAFDTSLVGSIGVIVAHHDYSAKLEKDGVKVTHIFAGKYKASGNGAEPLTEESTAIIQDRVDYFYTLFVDAVAKQRNESVQNILNNVANGKVYIGQQAKDIGLVDEIGGLDTALKLATQLINEGEDMKKTLAEQLAESSLDDALLAVAEAHGIELTDEQLAAFAPKPVAITVDPEMQAKLDALTARAELAEQALLDKAELDAQEEQHAHIISLLAPYNLHLNESLVALGEEIAEDSFATVIDVIESIHGKYKTLEDKLTTVTPDAHSVEAVIVDPKTFDEACRMVAARDSLDYDQASDKAATEFPGLFTNEFGGLE